MKNNHVHLPGHFAPAKRVRSGVSSWRMYVRGSPCLTDVTARAAPRGPSGAKSA
jgi:hypothetical protein